METIPLVTEAQRERQLRRSSSQLPELWALLDAVSDPEIPVVSLWDLGILQDIKADGDKLTVEITPTYSGCPAMAEIAVEIEKALAATDYREVEVVSLLTPTWTTDFMSSQGREKLREYGIAPPAPKSLGEKISCPQCRSEEVELISEFGSTACKALYRCSDCLEPFDYFKCI
ncbi:MAG: 1,2-phenylacetyl-CoA epoxidase subunit PaaD [Porticoccaceae bacterium]